MTALGRLALAGLAAVVASGPAVLARADAARQAAGRLLFVGTYTGDTGSKGIYAVRFDDRSGALTPAGVAAETTSPSFLTASTDGRFLYAVNEVSNYRGENTGSVTSFGIDRAAGRLTQIDVASSHGADPCHLALDRTGRFLAVANYTGGNFAVLRTTPDGQLADTGTVLPRRGFGPNKDRQEAPHAHAVVFDATNRALIGADLGTDRLITYQFDQETGAAKPASEAPVAAGAGPRHFVFHPTQPMAFSINELASTITTFGWDAASGRLQARNSISTLPAGYRELNSTAEIAVHPNGRFLYGSNRGHDSIAVFSIGLAGVLTMVERESTRGKTPRHFAIDPTGRWLIAANQESNTLAVFAIDQAKGSLAPVGPLASVPAPVSILFVN